MRWTVVTLALLVWIATAGWPAISGVWNWLGAEASPAEGAPLPGAGWAMARSVGFASLIATAAVVLAWPTGRVLQSPRSSRWWRPAMILPLLVPPQVWQYGWRLVIDPAGSSGAWLATHPLLAQWVPTVGVNALLAAWYWPVAAWALAHGFAQLDPQLVDLARLDTSSQLSLLGVRLRLMRGTMLTAWTVVWALALANFTAFELAGVDTYARALNLLFDLTGDPASVLRAGLPLVLVAIAVAVAVDRALARWRPEAAATGETVPIRSSATITAAIWCLLVAVPVMFMVGDVSWSRVVFQLAAVDSRAVAGSLTVGLTAAVLASCLAAGCVTLERSRYQTNRSVGRWMSGSLLAIGLLPGAVVGSAMIGAYHRPGLDWVYESYWPVALCHVAQFGFVAVLVTRWLAAGISEELLDLARLDGAGTWLVVRHVWWPAFGQAVLAAALVTVMLSAGEVSATIIALAPGTANLAQELYNQMHYLHQEQVVLLSLAWVVVAVACSLLLWLFGWSRFDGTAGPKEAGPPENAARRAAAVRSLGALVSIPMLVFLSGCGSPAAGNEVSVVSSFGRTGNGPGQFVYPRAVALAKDGTLFVVDKAARVQHFTPEGEVLHGWRMPDWKKGKPTGITAGDDGLLYVADTHYHRVMVFEPDGTLVRQFGSYGREPGQFIYPTDVAVARDGTLYVTEYGGNDRVSVFDASGRVLTTFGSLGGGEEQFSRPSAIALDEQRERIYVADACNHRISVFDIEHRVVAHFGGPGSEPGKLRYPYDLCFADDRSLLVCEYGNNRVQLFSPDGQSQGCWGTPGRRLAELAAPWGVAADSRGRTFVVDSGNDRIQVWRL